MINFYFVRSGYINPINGRLLNSGNYGDYWSGLAGSSNSAYELYFLSSDVGPSNYNNRYYGYPVRCVAGWE